MSRFTLTIRLGNEAMMDASDVATELRDIARDLEYGLTDDWVRDGNGNRVGEWRLDTDAVLEAEAERQELEDACPLCGAAACGCLGDVEMEVLR